MTLPLRGTYKLLDQDKILRKGSNNLFNSREDQKYCFFINCNKLVSEKDKDCIKISKKMIRKLSENSDFRARKMTRTRPDSGFRAFFGFSGNLGSGRNSVGQPKIFWSRVGRRSENPRIFARMRSPDRFSPEQLLLRPQFPAYCLCT